MANIALWFLTEIDAGNAQEAKFGSLCDSVRYLESMNYVVVTALSVFPFYL